MIILFFMLLNLIHRLVFFPSIDEVFASYFWSRVYSNWISEQVVYIVQTRAGFIWLDGFILFFMYMFLFYFIFYRKNINSSWGPLCRKKCYVYVSKLIKSHDMILLLLKSIHSVGSYPPPSFRSLQGSFYWQQCKCGKK